MSHRVVALVHAPQSPFELGLASEVFRSSRPGLRQHYDFAVCAEHPGPTPTSAGYDITVRHGLEAMDGAGTVIIPGWYPADAPVSPAVLDALSRAHAAGTRLVSICSGAFPLARTGLLDGRWATTHWALAERFAHDFPAVRLDPDVLYVDHGSIATSAGAGAGLDLCLHLVRSDLGAGYARQVARHMVMPPHREGGQLQYGAPPPPSGEAASASLAGLLEWASGRLAEPVTVTDMAAWQNVSPRTLARWFVSELGVSPGRWLLTQRITAARELLEETDLPMEAVAARVGLSTPANFRRRFHQALHTTPGAYRRAFRTRTASGGAGEATADASPRPGPDGARAAGSASAATVRDGPQPPGSRHRARPAPGRPAGCARPGKLSRSLTTRW